MCDLYLARNVGFHVRDWMCVCCFVLLTRYWGNRGPGVIPLIRGPDVAGSSPCTLSTSLATLVNSSSSSNGPTTTLLTTRGLWPGGTIVWTGPKFVRTHQWGVSRGRTSRPGANPDLWLFEPLMTITHRMAGRRIRSDDLRNNSPSLDRWAKLADVSLYICETLNCFENYAKIPAKKWSDTEIAERGRSVLVMCARYRSAGLTPHQRGWTDAGWVGFPHYVELIDPTFRDVGGVD